MMNQQKDSRSDVVEAERRQVTVVYVDLVGSSRLAEQLDPEDFGELIVAYRRAAASVIEQHGGFVARFLGDGILAYWGYPRAHEDDPARAVSAGWAIIAGMSEVNRSLPVPGIHLSVRVGIDCGVVVVGRLGHSATPAAYGAADIVGEAPNVAAHVQAQAEPNTVFVTETVRRLAQGQFEFVERGALEYKGQKSAIVIHRVAARLPERGRSRPARTAQIFGREVEKTMLDERWRTAQSGHGQIIFITGEQGIGKTTLADHLRRTVLASGGTCLSAGCFPESAHTPLLPVRDLLRQALGVAALDDLPTLSAKLASLVPSHGSEIVEDIVLPFLNAGSWEEQPARKTLEERKQRLFEFVQSWALTRARDAPLAVIIEDIHWADSMSRELLEALMDRVAEAPLCLILTWRAGVDADRIDRADATRINVMRLTDDAIDALVVSLMGEDAAEPEARRLVRIKAEGNPLFAEELAHLVREAQGRKTSADVLTLPSSLNDWLLARLDNLGELKRVAQVAAAIGREFEERVLAHVLDVPAPELAPKLQELVASGVVLDRIGLRASHSFKHALIRDAAYNSLLRAQRRVVHGKIANVLVSDFSQLADDQPELVAHHLEQAGTLGEAVGWWMRAGEQAARHSSAPDAIRHLERAMGILSAAEDGTEALRRAEVFNLLAGQYVAAHGNAAAQVAETYGRAVSELENLEAPPTTPMFTALWGLHTHAMVRADLGRALGIGDRMLALAEQEGDDEKLLQANRVQGLAQLLSGAHAKAEAHYGEVLRRYDPVRHENHRFSYGSDPAAVVLAQLAWGEWISGKMALSERHAREGIEQAQRIGHPHSIVHAIGVNALRLLTAREYERSQAAADEARALAQKFEFPYWIAWCDIIRAALRRLLDAEHSLLLLTDAIETYQRTGARQLIPYAIGLQARCLIDLDRGREAREILDRALVLARETGVVLYVPELLRLRARAAHQDRDPAHAPDLEGAMNVAKRHGALSFLLAALLTAFEQAGDEQSRARIRAELREIILRLSNEPETVDIRRARAVLGR